MAVDDSWPVVASRTIFRETKSQRPDVASHRFAASIARGQQDLPLRRKSARILSWQDLDSRCPTSVGEFQRFHLVNVFVEWQGVSAYDFFAPLTSKSNTYQTEKGLPAQFQCATVQNAQQKNPCRACVSHTRTFSQTTQNRWCVLTVSFQQRQLPRHIGELKVSHLLKGPHPCVLVKPAAPTSVISDSE